MNDFEKAWRNGVVTWRTFIPRDVPEMLWFACVAIEAAVAAMSCIAGEWWTFAMSVSYGGLILMVMSYRREAAYIKRRTDAETIATAWALTWAAGAIGKHRGRPMEAQEVLLNGLELRDEVLKTLNKETKK